MRYFERFPKKWDEIILNVNNPDKENSVLSLRVMWVRNNIIWDIKATLRD